MKNDVLIWGAGKIGRGFVAEAFYKGSFQLIFVDNDQKLIEKLRSQSSYSLINAKPGKDPVISEISDYTAHHISEIVQINKLVAEVSYIVVAVFPAAFDQLTTSLGKGIEVRALNEEPLDILLCTNARGANEQFGTLLRNQLSDRGKTYFDQHIGIVETIIMRVAVPTPDHFLSYGELSVTTNGFPYMPVNRSSFKKGVPEIPILKSINNFEAEETRKFYTYNMAHAVYAYTGLMQGCTTVTEAAANTVVKEEILGALNESAQALIAEYGFSKQEMEKWNQLVIANLTNPLLEDKLVRLGKDPLRKLSQSDRLVGPALLSKKHGLYPYYLTKAIARTLYFKCPEDNSTTELQTKLRLDGISATLTKIAGLQKDPELVSMVKRHYTHLQENPAIQEDIRLISLYKKAYTGGFNNEKKFHGCAQCALASMFDISEQKDENLFRTASAFAGGVGLAGDGICGGYAAGILWMGNFAGRRLEYFDGDKEEQYKSFNMTQKLRDRFIDTYGSIICKNIHETIFGRAYILLTKTVRNDFEAAGAHDDRCTSVVAISALWTTELLMDEGFIDIDKL